MHPFYESWKGEGNRRWTGRSAKPRTQGSTGPIESTRNQFQEHLNHALLREVYFRKVALKR